MTFNDNQKEIIRAIVKYGDGTKSMAQIINQSRILEKQGIGLVPYGGNVYVFLSKEKYDFNGKNGFAYITELLSLVETLTKNKLIEQIPFDGSYPLVIGKQNAKWSKRNIIAVDGFELISVDDNLYNWVDMNNEQIYWPRKYTEQQFSIQQLFPSICVSQELKDLVKHDFKTEDQIRFDKQQRLMWVSIIVTGVIGLVGLFVAIISLFISINHG